MHLNKIEDIENMELNKSNTTNNSPGVTSKSLIKQIPEGRHLIVARYYLIMLLFGVAVLIPTSSLLTALDYFIVRYPKYQPGFVIPLALNAPLFIFYGNRIIY